MPERTMLKNFRFV